MLVYSWKTLIVSTLLGGGIIVFGLKALIWGELNGAREYVEAFIAIMLGGHLLFKGLRSSLSGEGYDIEQREKVVYERAIRKLFGPWAKIAPWGGLISIFLAAGIFVLIPSVIWFPSFLFLGGLVYHVIVTRLIQKHVKIEGKNFY